MTVVVPGVGVITRKPKLKQLLFPVEIPAARFSCLTSGSFRPRLGLCILLLVLLTCLVFGVAPFVARSSIFPDLVSQITASKMSSEAVKLTSTAASKFSADLYNQLAQPSENMVMSSLSVSTVLAMLLGGAKGNTASQIESSLYQKSEDIMAGYKGVLQAIEALRQNKNITLKAANKIYPDAGFQIFPEYQALLQKHFMATIENLDFRTKSEQSRKIINQWVEDQTNKKIVELLASGTITPDTVMVLVNAIYFKGDWHAKFDKGDTMEMGFKVNDNKSVNVNMMMRKGKYAMTLLKDLNNAKALRMPYKGETIDMVFILPNAKDSMVSLEKSLKEVDFSKVEFSREMDVRVAIPRFKVESTHDLTNTLQTLGMKDMFNEKADLSGISNVPNLYVSTVVQKAFIEVNEEGAEAAAATAGVVMMRSALSEPEFICNRPFYFYIQERSSGMVLFSGKVTDPSV